MSVRSGLMVKPCGREEQGHLWKHGVAWVSTQSSDEDGVTETPLLDDQDETAISTARATRRAAQTVKPRFALNYSSPSLSLSSFPKQIYHSPIFMCCTRSHWSHGFSLTAAVLPPTVPILSYGKIDLFSLCASWNKAWNVTKIIAASYSHTGTERRTPRTLCTTSGPFC